MQTDERGLALTTDSAEAAVAYDAAVRSFFAWRTDVMAHLNAALEADPTFALARTLKGLLLTGLRQPGLYAAIGDDLATAQRYAEAASERERRYVAALEAMLVGDVWRAIALYEQIALDHPTDLVAIRLAQLELFWLGEAGWMRDISERAAPAWTPEVPGYSAYLGVRAFGLEEARQFAEAERHGRQAIELDPADCWAAHAVAHVMEMEGRLADGTAWLDGLADGWGGANQIVHHLWWHHCLFATERGDYAAALQTYDDRVRNPESPLVRAIPDFYLDIQNCAALLVRLELRGVDVGMRWAPIADIAAGRVGNHANPFTSPHCALALAAAGRDAEADALVAAMRDFAVSDRGTFGPRYAAAALPAAEAALAHRRGDHAAVLRILLPARRNLWQMGGSHAQRDLFTQILADSARRLERRDILRLLADELRGAGFARLDQRTSYAALD